jgi:hypothetical protein
MTTYTKEQLAELSGDKAYKGSPVGGSYMDTITLGKDGNFYISFYSQPKNERQDPEMIDNELIITILKIRRKLSMWLDKQNILDCVEYDAGTELIQTTDGEMSEKDAKKQGAKVALILYILYEGRMVKLSVSGGSLYNPDDEEDLRLYSYLQSFEEDEHPFMFETIIGAKENSYIDNIGETKTNYQMTFKKGKEHNNLDEIGEALTALPAILEENDARDFKFLGKNNQPKSSTSTVETNEEEINPDDVPF